MFAEGATPMMPLLLIKEEIMPETCVPCPLSSLYEVVPSIKVTPPLILKSGCWLIPVSKTATFTPLPTMP